MTGLGESVPWTRYWIPREYAPTLDWNGYLADPEDTYGKLANPHARTLEQLEDKRCVALLGEPGSGKSRVVEMYREGLLASGGAEPVLPIDCRWDHDLDAVLYASEPFKRWLAGSASLLLIIDSLDEHPKGAHQVAAQLIGQIQRGPVSSLRLRVACRTAEWPGVLDEQLPRLWKTENKEPQASFYALAPLRRVDVELAAGGDAAGFFEEVARVDGQPLAIKPITLGFLLEEFRRSRRLPSTRVELYTSGCTILCEETSRSREDAGRVGAFRPEDRLAIASRIAAVCVLGRRSLVHRGAIRGSIPAEAVRLDSLTGGTEQSPHGEVRVSSEAIAEVLKVSGLFAPRDAGYVGWSHQTYAEFLAARFLNERGLSPDQLLRELSSPTMNRIVPALRETAAWLASMNKGFFERLLVADPEPLLLSDFALIGHAEREALIEAVLQKMNSRELPAHFIDNMRSPLRRLDHPRLATQLRRYIADKTCYSSSRRVAIKLAVGCCATALEELLVDVALDHDDEIYVRAAAAHGVLRIGSHTTKLRLRPLAFGQCGPDPDDDLKGYALQALWPEDLVAAEMFACLTPPRNERYTGPYAGFIRKLGEALDRRHLSEALKWTLEVPRRYDASALFVRLLDKIMELAWVHIEVAEVRVAFAAAVRQRFEIYDEIFGRERSQPMGDGPSLGEDDERRRLLVLELVLSPLWSSDSSFDLAYKGLVLPRDVSWVIERVRMEADEPRRVRWAGVLSCLVSRYWSFDVLDPIIGSMDDVPEFGRVMPWLIKSVGLGSPESRWMRREERLQRKRWSRYRLKRHPAEKKLHAKKRVEECLRRFVDGNLDAGWRLQFWLMIDPERKSHSDVHDWDIAQFPGWRGADEETRSRVLGTAKEYLLRMDERAAEWLGKDVIYHPAAAGYRYLCLLDRLEPVWLEEHAEIWPRWTAISVAFAPNADEQSRRMTARAYRAQPNQVLAALGILLEKECRRHGYPFSLYKMAECWDDRLARFLLEFAKRVDLSPRFLGELLDELLGHKADGAAECAASMLVGTIPEDGDGRLRKRAAAHALMAFAPENGWSVVRPLIDLNPAFVREVFLSFARERTFRRSDAWGKSLSVAQAADVYVWMARTFPHADDPQDRSRGFTEVTPRHQVAELRDALLNELTSRGTPEAVEAILTIQRELPQNDLSWAIVSAKEAAAQGTWTPRTAREIIELRPHPARPRATPNPTGLDTMTSTQLLDALCTLLPPQLDNLIFKLGVPTAFLPGPYAPPASRITEILRWAEQQGRVADVERLYLEVTGHAVPLTSPMAAPVVAASPVVALPVGTPSLVTASPIVPGPITVTGVTFPPPLVAAYQQNKLAVLFGSGLSLARDVKGDFPRWGDLPERLLAQAEKHGALASAQINAKRAFFASGHLSLESMLSELDTLKTSLRNLRKYQAALNAIFRPVTVVPGDVHRALIELGVVVLATTNYDPLLEAAEGLPARTPYTWLESDKALLDIEDGRKVLFKLHGTADREETVVMTQGEYTKAVAYAPYQRTLSWLLQGYTFLLVGYGVNDPLDLDLVFELNDRAFGAAARTHYALFKDASANDRDRWQRDLNVQVVPYANHDDLPAILRALRASKP